MSRRAVVVSAVRTPIGRINGLLAGVRPDDLAALVVEATMCVGVGQGISGIVEAPA